MIGSLLKELVLGLRRYAGHQLGRLTNSKRPAAVPQADNSAETASGSVERRAPLRDEGLASLYGHPTVWSTSHRDVESEEVADNPVFQLWKQHKPRAHKWPHYFDIYHATFAPLRNRSLRVLEIGVYKGASLRLWRRYFENPSTVIVGIDIDPACAEFDSAREAIHVRIGSQADAAFLGSIAREFGPFDIIIDDGSHYSSHMITSFNVLFADALRDGGIYLAEDLHANYWIPFRDTRFGFLDLCKGLVELMHAHYTQFTLAEWTLESERQLPTLSVNVPAITKMIKEIRFFDSIVVIYKSRREFLPRILDPTAD